MQNNDDVNTIDIVCPDRLDLYRQVIAGRIKRLDLRDNYLAARLGINCSYFGKVRRGLRPITPRLVEDLIALLELDRVRLAFAVDVMNDPDAYFDRAFEKVCIYVQTVLVDTVRMTRETGGFERDFLFGAMPADRCEQLARSAVDQLRDQFAAIDAATVHRRVA